MGFLMWLAALEGGNIYFLFFGGGYGEGEVLS